MALSRNRIIGNLASAIDSASQNSFLSKASQDGEYKSLAYSDLSGAPTVLDSAGISAVIDSSYTQLRITPVTGPTKSVDSAVVTSLIDSNYVTNRAAAASNTGFTTYNYTATAGQTTFQDSDLSGNILSYTAGGTMVWMNGVMLKETADWTGTDGSSIVLDSAANAGAKITIAKWNVLASGGAGGAAAAWYGDRGVIAGGVNSSYAYQNTIQYFDITTTGNTTDFGDLTTGTSDGCIGQVSSGTYGLFAGGDAGVYVNTIEYVTIASPGNATDFGDLNYSPIRGGSCADGTYGLFGGGRDVNTIDYVTISTPANASDFGDLTVATQSIGACGDGTYGVFWQCYSSNTIDYVTIASPSNATDFGDSTLGTLYNATVSDDTYGLKAGGRYNNGSWNNANQIEYLTIASPSNASDFGDLTVAKYQIIGVSNGTYGCWAGAHNFSNVIEYNTIATPGNSTDFGDLVASIYGPMGTSGSPS